MKNQLKVLVVDDEMELRRSVNSILYSKLPNFEVHIDECENGKEALQRVQSAQTYDLILMDVRMPEMNGIEALEAIKTVDPKVFVVIMTAHSNLKDAVNAIRLGAYDYLEKPVQPERLKEIVEKAMEARAMVRELAISNPIFDDDVDSDFVGSSEKMNVVFDLIYRLSKVDTTVLIRGENGTGKELVAKGIHSNSHRKSGDFIAINCGAIPENLMESELFGHEKGAFTGASERKIGKFQAANKGTLFLDEIGELRPEMQVKLLRVLQERKFVPVGSNREVATNARVVAATNRNLEKMMAEGLFREDLFYRLNVMPIFLPPLRERIGDLKQLTSHFIRNFNKVHNREIKGLKADALNTMMSYRWPGNIRELENVIERAFIVENTDEISLASLPENIRESESRQVSVDLQGTVAGPMDFDQFKEATEKEFIVQALRANGGRINKTVAEANIPKNTLLRKIKKYKINVKELGGVGSKES